MQAASQQVDGRRERMQWSSDSGTSVSKSILATTFRLCTYGSLAYALGFFLWVGITFRLALCCLVFFLLDGWATSWLNSLGDDDTVRKFTRIMCIAGQVTMLTTTAAFMPVYHIPLVRAGCLIIGPSILSIGFSHDVWETCAVLLVHFAIVAASEADPAFLLCMAIKDSWLVFGAWKGKQLVEATQREAALRHHYNRLSERMMQQALNLLLDCTLVVEKASEVCAGPGGGPAAEGAGAPGGRSAWRVRDEDRAADHFFGVAMRTMDVFELVPSQADQRRVQEALRKATDEEEKVSTMLSNVSMRCSALTGAAAKTVQGGSTTRGSDDELLINADVDLVIVGRGELVGPSDHLHRATALVGVRAAEKARDSCIDDLESDEIERTSRRIEELSTGQNETGDAASTHSSSSVSSATARDMGCHQHVSSVSVVVDVFSERLDVKHMVLHLSEDNGAADKSSMIIPGLADWLHADELEYTREWMEEGAKAAASDKLADLPGHGPIRFYCGQKAFVEAADVEVERLDIRKNHWRGSDGDDSSEEVDDEKEEEECEEQEENRENEGDEEKEDDHTGLSKDGESRGLATSLEICLRLRGITKMFWPPWADSLGYHHYVKHALRRHGDQADLRRHRSLRPIAEHRRRCAVETGELCSLK